MSREASRCQWGRSTQAADQHTQQKPLLTCQNKGSYATEEARQEGVERERAYEEGVGELQEKGGGVGNGPLRVKRPNIILLACPHSTDAPV
jgi:hypothetical protein